MIRRAERGLLPGNVPYGWRKVFDADGKPHFEIDEQAATAVRKAFEWFLAGEGKEAIAIRLNAEALANCFRREVVNHASILSSVLVTNYAGEKYSAAYLVNLAWNARDSDLWQKHRFQISIAQ